MNSASYRSFLRVLEKWPVDSTKKGRDLGEFIRIQVASAFRVNEPNDSNKCQEICESLNKIASNKYKEAFFISGNSSASGLSGEECKQLISNEFLELMEKEDKSLRQGLKERIFGKKDKEAISESTSQK